MYSIGVRSDLQGVTSKDILDIRKPELTECVYEIRDTQTQQLIESRGGFDTSEEAVTAAVERVKELES